MNFDTKIALCVAEDLEPWQKLNVVSFLTSGIIGNDPTLIGEQYRDAQDNTYPALCIQPITILGASREKLATCLQRARSREVDAAIYIEDMFASGHDTANRETVVQYAPDQLPLVGMGLRSESKTVDKIFKGIRLHT
jgi:hypothetical protein